MLNFSNLVYKTQGFFRAKFRRKKVCLIHGKLRYISVYAKYSGEQLRTIGLLVLHIHIENLKKFLVKNQLSNFKIIWQQLSLSRPLLNKD